MPWPWVVAIGIGMAVYHFFSFGFERGGIAGVRRKLAGELLECLLLGGLLVLGILGGEWVSGRLDLTRHRYDAVIFPISLFATFVVAMVASFRFRRWAKRRKAAARRSIRGVS